MNIYSSMDAAVVLYIVSNCCLSIFKHCWLTTGSCSVTVSQFMNYKSRAFLRPCRIALMQPIATDVVWCVRLFVCLSVTDISCAKNG